MDTWTAKQVATHLGVTRTSVMRYIKQEKFPNAYKDSAGEWKIPISDVQSSGVNQAKYKPKQGDEQSSEQFSDDVNILRNRVQVLESELNAEKRISENLQETIEDYRRMLPPAPKPSEHTVTMDNTEEPKKNWFQKLFS